MLRRVAHHFGSFESGSMPVRRQTAEPEQLGERRVTVSRAGTTAYLKLAYHAPSVSDPDFVSTLLLDAVLTGAKGVNLWSSFGGDSPQRSARLYRALVNQGLASSVQGALLPTQDPFLYTLSMTATAGIPLAALEEATSRELDAVRREGVTPEELAKAKKQLRARLVFENDSVTNIAHQLGYFQTWRFYPALGPLIQEATLSQVGEAAARRLPASGRTVGWFQPLADQAAPASRGQGAGAAPAAPSRAFPSGAPR